MLVLQKDFGLHEWPMSVCFIQIQFAIYLLDADSWNLKNLLPEIAVKMKFSSNLLHPSI